MKKPRILLPLLGALAAAFFTGCFEGGGTETGNAGLAGVIDGKVHDGGGTETGNTEVFLVSIKYQGDGADSSKFRSTRTDAQGRFRFTQVDAGRYALGIPGSGETPLSALATRLTAVKDGRKTVNLTVRTSVTLVGRALPDSGQPAALAVCMPGLLRCVEPSPDSTFRLPDAPVGAYELVYLTAAQAHYLSVKVDSNASGTVYLRDLLLKTKADADHVPYSFYDVGRSASFSSLPVRYAANDLPAWYAGKDFGKVEYFLLSEAAPPQAWNADFFTAWKYRLALSGDALMGGPDFAAPIPGFPLPVRLTAANFNFAQARGDGSDLVVSDGQGKYLPHRIERWDSAGGKAAVWIRMETLAAARSARTVVLHWGLDNTPPPSPAGKTPSGDPVFRKGDGFIGAWHLGEQGSDSLVHDAQGLFPARLRGTAPAGGFGTLRGDGVVGGGYRFAAKNWVNIGYDTAQDVTRTMTVAMWVRLHAQDTIKALFASKWAVNKREWHLHMLPNRSLELEFGDAQGAIVGAWRTVDPMDLADLVQWHHYAATFDNGVVKLYIDGVEVPGILAPDVPGFKNGTIPKAITRFGSAVNLGSNAIDHSLDLDGDLDEFWYSPEAKSADWIRAAYESQKPR